MPRSLFVEILEARVNPAFFTARTDIGQVRWADPAAWSDDPAATEVPGPGDTVFVEQGEWDVDLGGVEVEIDKLVTQGVGGTAPDKITLHLGTLRLSQPSVLANKYTDEGTAPPLVLEFDRASLVAGGGQSGGDGRVVVYNALRMDRVAALGADLSVVGQATLFGAEFKSVSVEGGGELLTFPAAPNPDGSGLKVGLTTGSLENHGTLAGVTAFPGFLHATEVINHGYADLSGGARLTGDLVNHNKIRVSGPTVHVANFTNTETGVVRVDGRPLVEGLPALVVAGTAKLAGTVYVEQMGAVPQEVPSKPLAGDFMRFARSEGRFRELLTPNPAGDLPTTGLRDPDAEQFVGLDYEATQVAFSLIDFPLVAPAGEPLDPFADTKATGLVMVFGGATGDPRTTTMADPIARNIRSGTWDVLTIDYTAFSKEDWDPTPLTRRWEYANNSYDLAQSLAYFLRNHGRVYQRYHVIGLSMGSWPADGFTDALSDMEIAGKGHPVRSHLTLLDSYVSVGSKINGRELTAQYELGNTATWGEQYQDRRDEWDDLTIFGDNANVDLYLPNVFNIDVEHLDPGTEPPLVANFRGHFFTVEWYEGTTKAPLPPAGFQGEWWGYFRTMEYAGDQPNYDALHQPGGLVVLTFSGSTFPPTPRPPGGGPVRTTAVGAGARVFVVGPDGKIVSDFAPFDASFTGQVRTAAADVNGDGVADIVAGTGPGAPTRVRVFDGKTQAELFSVDPFEASFTGGVYVAAGDLNGDGLADIVITPDEGGGPRARVFSGKGFGQLADFFGIEDVNFRGGARPAIGDITGDGKADLVVAAGFGGGPRVGVFDGAKLATEGGLADQGAARWNTWKPFGDFLAFEPALRNGTFVAVGDLDGDRYADLIAGGGPGGGPRVTAFNGRDLLNNTQTAFVNFFAGDVNNRGGVRVSVKDLDGDAKTDLVVGAGTGGGSRVTGYLATTITTATPMPAFDFDAIAGFTGGVFVG